MTKNAALDQAIQAFHDKKWQQASDAMVKLLADEALPSGTKHRLSQFKTIADRHLVTQEEDPEALSLKMVSYHMNTGDRESAREILNKSDIIAEGTRLFLEAEMAMEEDDREKAIEYLNQAIEKQKDNRGYALNSPVFSPFINEPEFEFLRQGKDQQESEEASA
ncbi:hypothetical protein SCOR_18200 [Sulfidibacter corallicola]|uniref:Tetratricopeptide repeat protein n=1 Tax=Sulfidibacter corallicola TaxID=2818388 RepID=A0A8A4TWW4_SULCO|nr:hypothetical protein [Sulfidibacter corallicola]QTD53614.1 hypothetical protein J3U87_14260 [Sulfidibacter corallicola]